MRGELKVMWGIFALTFFLLWAMSYKPAGGQIPDYRKQTVTIIPVTPNKQMMKTLPPEEYDHWYEGDLTIKMVDSVEHLALACKWPEVRPTSLGCATVRPNYCIIYLVQDEVVRAQGWNNGIILRHEMGHCNGWPGDHPRQRAITPGRQGP